MVIYRLLYFVFLSWILLFVISTKGYAQNIDFEFLHLGKEEGLPANDINAFIFKDSKGFVWISSLNGCYRYDGVNLKHYKIDQNGRYNAMVQSDFWEDDSGDLWLTSYDALHHYDRKKDKIESIQFYQDTLSLKSDYHILYFNKSKNRIWLKAEKGFWAYEVKMKTNHTDFFKTKGARFAIDTTKNGDLNQIYSFTWLPNTGFEIWQKSESEEWSMELMNNGILGEARISKGIIENDSTLWLVSNLGLIEFNTKDRKIRNQFQLLPSTKKGFNSAVLESENLLVLSTSDQGLWSFDTKKKIFIQNLLHDDRKDKSLFSNQPRDLYIDADNRLWISYLGKGIDYSMKIVEGVVNPLSTQNRQFHIKNIIEDKQHHVFVLTQDEGVFVFNLDQELIYHLKETLTGERIKHLSIDGEGVLWIIADRTIYKSKDLEEFKQHNWELVYKGDIALEILHHDILESKILTGKEGVFKLDEDNLKLQKVDLFKEYTSMEFNHFFKAFDNDFIIPFNRQDSWLLSSKTQHFSFDDSLHLNFLVHQVLGSQDNKFLWLAGNKGLFTIDEKKELKQVLSKNELGEYSNIFSLLRDDNGLIWFSTWRGIWSFDVKSKKLLLAIPWENPPNGLFYFGPGLKTSDGNLWFEQRAGISVFDPKTFVPAKNTANVYLNNIWVNNKIYNNDISLNELKKIKLKYFENTIDLQLNILDIEFAEKSHFLYRLNNYDDTWVKRKSGEIATFTKIPPGQYEFEYRVVDEHNQFGEINAIAISIPPPFWLTWWFKWLLLFSTIGFIFLLVNTYYKRKLKLEKKALEEQQLIHEERNRIASELHDDMGGSLSSILYIVNDSLLEENSDHQKQQLERVVALTQNSLANMRDIIWVLDNDQSTLEDLVIRLRQFSSTFLMDHQLSLEFTNEISPNENVILSSEKKRNLFLIVKEGLHNIVKHANAKSIKITITTSTVHLKIELVDDGDGFNQETRSDSGFGLSNMQDRSKVIGGTLELRSTIGNGVLLLLEIPL